MHFVLTPFDCKDENSFCFSLFVEVYSVLLIWIKHSLLFRNTVEPPLTTTSTQRPSTATRLQWPFFFFQLYLETILSCWKVMTVLAVVFLLLEIVEPQRKKKKRKKGKAEQGTEAGELIVIQRFI